MDEFILLPNDFQREALCGMMHEAFVEIRALAWQAKSEQAADLADAFHNLPKEMYGWGKWDVNRFRGMLQHYHDKYPRQVHGGRDYVAMLDRVFPSA